MAWSRSQSRKRGTQSTPSWLRWGLIFDDRDIEWAVATRFQGHKGLIMIENARGSSLDPSADDTTTKMGIDATKPIGGEGFDRVTVD
jgi:3-polyprenyl-4-hydroxybenzoate decarboxylase